MYIVYVSIQVMYTYNNNWKRIINSFILDIIIILNGNSKKKEMVFHIIVNI